MRKLCNRRMLAGVVGVFGALFGTFDVENVEAQTTNSWRFLSGKWELGTNWTINLPPTNNSFVFITNATTKTVTIDAVTTNSPTTMTITNLTLSAPGGSVNTLLLSDPGTNTPLRIANAFTITAGGVLQISNGVVQIDKAGAPTIRMIDDGQVWMHTAVSRLVNTNGNLHIGNSATGLMTVSNGTVLAEDMIIGNSVGGNGTLTMAGGTNLAIGNLTVGNSSGTVWVTGGRLVVTNNFKLLNVGNGGIGRLTLSNGTVLAQAVRVGGFNGGRGTLTIAGGTNSVSSALVVSDDTNTSAAVWLTGGQLVATNATTTIGVGGAGQMTISNGVLLANTVRLGTNLTGNGSLTLAGGIAAMIGPLEIGFGGTGTVNVLSGGLLAITSTPATVTSGSGLLIDGSVTLTNNGAIIVSNFPGVVVGNRGSGSLTMNGGSITSIYGNLTAGFTTTGNGEIWVNGTSSLSDFDVSR